MRARGSSQSGFSLIELMVVVLIVGLLTSIAIPVFARAMDKAYRAAAAAATRDIYVAMTRYNADHGFFPTSIDYTTLAPLSTEGYLDNPDSVVSKFADGELSLHLAITPEQFWIVTQSRGKPPNYFIAARTTIWWGGGQWTDGTYWYDYRINDLVSVDEAM